MSHAVRKLPVCPNCGTHLSWGENYCPTCGQPNHDLNISFGHIVEETLEGVFHFDSKVWLTFKELLFKPGLLTVHFVEGRRASYVPPIRLYIFISLVFFFLLGKETDRQRQRGQALQIGTPVSLADTTQGAERRTVSGAEALQLVRDSLRAQPGTNNFRLRFDSTAELTNADLRNRPLMERVSEGDQHFLDSLIRARGGEPSLFRRLMYRQTARLAVKQDGLGHQFVKNTSVGMFLLMPLFALLVKLFYRRQRPLYVQHLIFSVHLHSFFFLFFSVLILLDFVLPAKTEIPPAIPTIAAWAYWVMALRQFSGQSYKRTLWKGSLLFAGYMGIIVLFAVGVALTSLLLF